MITYTDALARWRTYHDVTTHVVRCQCDECWMARNDALDEADAVIDAALALR